MSTVQDICASQLCTNCGLCCDGTLFADAELSGRREANEMESLGLDVEDEGNRFLLVQPCRGLRGRHCRVYSFRPECCRTFECRLLKDYHSKRVSLSDAMALIVDVRSEVKKGTSGTVKKIIAERFLA